MALARGLSFPESTALPWCGKGGGWRNRKSLLNSVSREPPSPSGGHSVIWMTVHRHLPLKGAASSPGHCLGQRRVGEESSGGEEQKSGNGSEREVSMIQGASRCPCPWRSIKSIISFTFLQKHKLVHSESLVNAKQQQQPALKATSASVMVSLCVNYFMHSIFNKPFNEW